jgi:subtilisin family serine protease
MSGWLVVMACSAPHASLIERLGGDDPRLFSDRPTQPGDFIALIQLKTPALLTTAHRQNGVNIIDPQQQRQLENEQQQALSRLRKISAEIRVLFRYRLVLNGLAVVVPPQAAEKLRSEMNVTYVEKETPFARPQFVESPLTEGIGVDRNLNEKNSVRFIGADKLGVTGQDIRVGVIDTGIDYTHRMFGGPGTAAAYAAIDPAKPTSAFPTSKVVGGIDLVGSLYDSVSGNNAFHVPMPDPNPLDEARHGTHVAGTIAGQGDGVNTFSGVAPGANLYAIKVFGRSGATGDAVVVAALEYAANPARNGDLHDQLDVVNLSLGSAFGQPHVLYQEAIRNLSRSGTVVVASAGNSGNMDFAVGSPSSVEEAISVAASVDDSEWNWKTQAVKFYFPDGKEQVVPVIEGPITQPVADISHLEGRLVDLGYLDHDLSAEQAASVRGQVALVTRGKVSVAEKLRRAVSAGARAMIVAMDEPGDAFAVGGEGHFDLPGCMVTQDFGKTLREELAHGEVKVIFDHRQAIAHPELIDSIADFSSKGPRSTDALLKPEITAPGQGVVSAAMGQGDQGVKMSGTSMASPHIAGVIALLKQLHPQLSSQQLKSLLLGSAKVLVDEKKKPLPLSRQGAGRVQAVLAAQDGIATDAVDFSLGLLRLKNSLSVRKSFRVSNISSRKLTLEMRSSLASGLRVQGLQTLTLAPGESRSLTLNFLIDASSVTQNLTEKDGMISFWSEGKEMHHLPVLALVEKPSQIRAQATSAATLKVQNQGDTEGEILPLNLLGLDSQEDSESACDLQAVGYRIIRRAGDVHRLTLQLAVKLFEPTTIWNQCEISALIDTNGDGVPEQELAGVALSHIRGFSISSNEGVLASVLLNAPRMRQIRRDFEVASRDPRFNRSVNYSEAVEGINFMTGFTNSSVALLDVDTSQLALGADGKMHFQIATIAESRRSSPRDDFLETPTGKWFTLSLDPKDQPFSQIPEKMRVPPGTSLEIPLQRGSGKGKLLLLMPQNESSRQQMQLL